MINIEKTAVFVYNFRDEKGEIFVKGFRNIMNTRYFQFICFSTAPAFRLQVEQCIFFFSLCSVQFYFHNFIVHLFLRSSLSILQSVAPPWFFSFCFRFVGAFAVFIVLCCMLLTPDRKFGFKRSINYNRGLWATKLKAMEINPISWKQRIRDWLICMPFIQFLMYFLFNSR